MHRRALVPVLVIMLAACGSDTEPSQADAAIDGSAAVDASADTPPGAFTLTSTVLSEGAAFPTASTCDGANTSPELAWTSPPASAQSFAVVLTDKTNDLVHWVIFDVPASAMGLPAAIMKVYSPTDVPGAHQTTSFQPSVTGYLGPCPPQNQGAHTYEIAAYALDVATLPGASSTTTRQEAVPLIMQHALGSARLTGSFER